MNDYKDILIVGGGLVGASLACALEPLGLQISISESKPFANKHQASFDERTIAITWSSRQILKAIGVWDEISHDACSIKSIHVSDRGRIGMTRLDSSLINTEALGYVIPSRTIGQCLVNRLHNSSSIHYQTPATAKSVQLASDSATIFFEDSQNSISTSLLVIADGGRSSLADQIGIQKSTKHYSQSVVVTTLATDRPHHGVAYERFTNEGPIAFLPIDKFHFSLAWTMPTYKAELHAKIPTSDFLTSLQTSFGDRAGLLKDAGVRTVYSLQQTSVVPPVAHRTVLIGNAAHEVHPVAGQGFNLGLRDAAELAEVIARATENGEDIGKCTLIDHYAVLRERQTQRVLAFTDNLIQLFGITTPGVGLLRSFGLSALELLPPAKRLLLKRTAGLAGRQPKLARGLPLLSPRNFHGSCD